MTTKKKHQPPKRPLPNGRKAAKPVMAWNIYGAIMRASAILVETGPDPKELAKAQPDCRIVPVRVKVRR